MGCDNSKIAAIELERLDVTELARNYEEPNYQKVKILLLGAGESGKTTILKQLTIIHLRGFSMANRKQLRSSVYCNIFRCVEELYDGVKKIDIKIDDKTEEDFQTILGYEKKFDFSESGTGIPEEITQRIIGIYRSRAIALAYARRHEFQLSDAIGYFFEHLKRISAAEYVPTDDDILWTRVQTTGVQTVNYIYRNFEFRVFDVPGQRSHRRKWIHFFDNVDAVIFVVAVSEYDQTIREDDRENRMAESLRLFESCINSPCLQKAQAILFFNKIDIFKEKINRVPIKQYFPDYVGPTHAYEEGMQYFEEAFKAKIKKPAVTPQEYPQNIYIHRSCATDRVQLLPVLNSAADTVLAAAYASVGLC